MLFGKLKHVTFGKRTLWFFQNSPVFSFPLKQNGVKINMFLYFTFNEILLSKDENIFTSSCATQIAK